MKNAFQIAEMIFQTHAKLQISVFCTKSNPFSVYTTGYMLSMALQGKTKPDITEFIGKTLSRLYNILLRILLKISENFHGFQKNPVI